MMFRARFPFLVLALLAPLGLALAQAPESAPAPEPREGVSVFGDLKYPTGFAHFDYVDPAAPRTGTLRLAAVGTFDTLNPFTLKGTSDAYLATLAHDSLMEPAADEPDSRYGLIARSVQVAPDRRWAVFHLRPEARFSDGTPITAEDVVFSLEAIRTRAHPTWGIVYRDVASAEAIDAHTVRFIFTGEERRDLPLHAADLPILSKAYWTARDFTATTLDPPVSSGPYRIENAAAGRGLTYVRNPDYWAADLPVNRGRWNFERIRVDYYRDRDVQFQAFKAGDYDVREEFTSRLWAEGYDFPAVAEGRVKRVVLPDERPSGVQAYFLNLRRPQFMDRRVREAMGLAFDFEWTNRNIFFGAYHRTRSMYENSDLAAAKPPSPAELALLEPLREQVPVEVFTTPFQASQTDGSGRPRENLMAAARLLDEAGWKLAPDGMRRNAEGLVLRAEFLMFEPSFERVNAPYVANLKRLGVDARMRMVDPAQYEQRRKEFDYDIIVGRFIQPLTPGIEQRSYWGSEAAGVVGTLNLSGIADPAVDALVERVVAARSRPELRTACRALDRVLMWNRFVVPQWYKGEHTIAYWDKFGMPATKPRYAIGMIDTWWIRPEAVPAAPAAPDSAPGSAGENPPR